MKIKIALILLCLCFASGIYAQSTSIADGTYVFEEAQLIIQKLDSKEVVEHKTIRETTSVDANDIHLANVILEVEIQNEKPVAYILSDKKRYRFDESMPLAPALDDKEMNELGQETLVKEYLFLGKELAPHQQKTEGKKLTITFETYNFGQSGVNYTMTAKLIVILTKLN